MFRDDIKADLSTFVTTDEFADLIEVNGVICRAQLMHHTQRKSERQNETYDGLHGDFTELFFMTEPYVKKKKELPKHGDWIYVGDVRYDVLSCEDEKGMVHMVLSSYRQGGGFR